MSTLWSTAEVSRMGGAEAARRAAEDCGNLGQAATGGGPSEVRRSSSANLDSLACGWESTLALAVWMPSASSVTRWSNRSLVSRTSRC